MAIALRSREAEHGSQKGIRHGEGKIASHGWPSLASAAASRPGRAGAQAETITVTHWGGQFYGVPYAVAMDKGFFKQNGVDVTGILTAAGGGTAVRNTLAGGIPFGEVSLAAAVQAINSGQKLIISAPARRRSADQMWVVKKDSPLQASRIWPASGSAIRRRARSATWSS